MLDTDAIIIDAFVGELKKGYKLMYGENYHPEYGSALETCARTSANLVSANADTPYHGLNHLIDVTLLLQEILFGKHTLTTVEPLDWFESLVASPNHDVGYILKLFSNDVFKKGVTGASITKEHVDRSMRYVRERYKKSKIVNGENIANLIDYTRIPVIKAEDTESYGGLLRAADCLSSIINVDFRKKGMALFSEFKEAGLAEKSGYRDFDDLITDIPRFFEEDVRPLAKPAMEYLKRTREGKRIVSSLWGIIKQCERYSENLEKG